MVTQPSKHNWAVAILYVISIALIAVAIHKIDANSTHAFEVRTYQACLITNKNRHQSNKQWSAVKDFFNEASATRSATSAISESPKQKKIDEAAAKKYSELAAQINTFAYSVCVNPDK